MDTTIIMGDTIMDMNWPQAAVIIIGILAIITYEIIKLRRGPKP